MIVCMYIDVGIDRTLLMQYSSAQTLSKRGMESRSVRGCVRSFYPTYQEGRGYKHII
jgi:hypothetical protein